MMNTLLLLLVCFCAINCYRLDTVNLDEIEEEELDTTG